MIKNRTSEFKDFASCMFAGRDMVMRVHSCGLPSLGGRFSISTSGVMKAALHYKVGGVGFKSQPGLQSSSRTNQHRPKIIQRIWALQRQPAGPLDDSTTSVFRRCVSLYGQLRFPEVLIICGGLIKLNNCVRQSPPLIFLGEFGQFMAGSMIGTGLCLKPEPRPVQAICLTT